MTQDCDGGYDEPYVEREHKLQPHLGIGCHAMVKACFDTKVKIEPSNELTQYWNTAIRKEDTSALTYLDNTSIEYEPIDGTNGDSSSKPSEELPNHTQQQQRESSKPTDVCFCDDNNTINCSQTQLTMTAYPGEEINISVVTVGQLNGKPIYKKYALNVFGFQSLKLLNNHFLTVRLDFKYRTKPIHVSAWSSNIKQSHVMLQLNR